MYTIESELYFKSLLLVYMLSWHDSCRDVSQGAYLFVDAVLITKYMLKPATISRNSRCFIPVSMVFLKCQLSCNKKSYSICLSECVVYVE